MFSTQICRCNRELNATVYLIQLSFTCFIDQIRADFFSKYFLLPYKLHLNRQPTDVPRVYYAALDARLTLLTLDS